MPMAVAPAGAFTALSFPFGRSRTCRFCWQILLAIGLMMLGAPVARSGAFVPARASAGFRAAPAERSHVSQAAANAATTSLRDSVGVSGLFLFGAAFGLLRAASRRGRCMAVARRAASVAEVEDRVAAAEAQEKLETSTWRGFILPITKLVGLEDVKLALRLACIDPSLGGVGISGGHGTAKTTLARSLKGILPRVEVVSRSICNCDPARPDEWDALTQARLVRDKDGEVETKVIDCPFVELPLGCTEDRLVGSLDVQASMEQGKPIFEPGLLAQAHRGVLYIDDINLLQDDLVSLLLTAIESGVNRVEREGLSVAHPCRPLVVATWNPEEAPLRPHLVDRLAIALNTDAQTVYTNIDERVSAVNATFDFNEDPSQAAEDSQEEISSLQTQLLFAREFVKDVSITEEQLKRLADEAARGMCEGHRAEVFAAKIARAHAALNGRDAVSAEDLQIGIKLAIIPRVRVRQTEEDMEDMPPPPPQPQFEEDPDQEQEQDDQEEEEDDEEEMIDEPEDEDDDEEVETQQELPEEFMISAAGAVIDEDLLKFQNKEKRSGRSGARSKIYSMDRGRYVKAVLPRGGDSSQGKIALDATLRTAVIYQKMRKEEAQKKLQPGEELREVYVEKSDIWIKKMARKAGALVVFIVDASGSMALNRMQNAKGAVLRLLESAYQSRDQVALIPCRGLRADVLVPPTSSVARASKSMQVLPCGGGTPLAHAMRQAITLGSNALKGSDVGQVCVVAITDGRANVPLGVSEGENTMVDEEGRIKKVSKDDLQEEVFAMADTVRAMGFKFLLIDTENKYVSSGLAKEVAERAGGKYYYLPRADDTSIASIAGAAVAEMKS